MYSSQYGCQYWGTLLGRPTLSPRQHLIDSSNILTLKYTLDHQASVPRCIKENILKQKAAHFPTLNLTIKQFFLAPILKRTEIYLQLDTVILVCSKYPGLVRVQAARAVSFISRIYYLHILTSTSPCKQSYTWDSKTFCTCNYRK